MSSGPPGNGRRPSVNLARDSAIPSSSRDAPYIPPGGLNRTSAVLDGEATLGSHNSEARAGAREEDDVIGELPPENGARRSMEQLNGHGPPHLVKVDDLFHLVFSQPSNKSP